MILPYNQLIIKTMKKLIPLSGLCLMIAMQSCTSGDEPTFTKQQEAETVMSHMVIKFDNHIYETDVITIGDSVKYLNEEYDRIYHTEIANSNDMSTVISEDESGTCFVEYFKSEKEVYKKHNFLQLGNRTECDSNYTTRSGVINLMQPNGSSGILARAELYDDHNFKDTELITYATTTWQSSVPRLKDLGFNDKTSSIKVFNLMKPNENYTIGHHSYNFGFYDPYTHSGSGLRPVLKCYKDSDYSGTTILFCIASPTGNPNDHLDYNLKGIGWGDKISSFEWLLVYNFKVFAEPDPEIPAHDPC